jgi:putative ABC transport system permease protein
MLIDFFIYSIKNLKNRKLRTWLTLLGIVMGIASVIALTTVGDGLRLGVSSQFGATSADIITIQASGVQGGGPPGSGVPNPLKKEWVEDIDKISGVDVAIGRLISTLKIEFNNIEEIGFAGSVPYGNARTKLKEIQGLKAAKGRLLKDGDRGKVVVGNTYADSGSEFKKAMDLGNKIKINDKDFEIIGIMKKMGSFITDNAFFINEDEQRDLTGNTKYVSLIAVKVQNLNDMEYVKANIEKYLRKKRDVKVGEEDFSVQTAEASLKSVNSVLGGVQAFIVIIAAISMIVGAIGIINTMFTSVLERRKEIGIMKAIGAKNSDIFVLFLVESGMLGLIGGLIGLILGKSLGILGNNAISSWLGIVIPLRLDISFMLLTLIGSFLLGAISGIVPAMQAAKLPPVEALRQ